MKFNSAAVGVLFLALAAGCGDSDSAKSEPGDHAAYGARPCATWFAYMGYEDRFAGADWLLRNTIAEHGIERDMSPDLMTIEKFMDGITEACSQTSSETLLETVADDLFTASEDF